MAKLSDKTKNLKQSGIRASTVKCQALGGINLGQGTCEIPTLDLIKKAAFDAIEHDKNIYCAYDGIPELREAIIDKLKKFNHIHVDQHTAVMVTHGAIGAYVAAINTLFNPGDEVILFEPFYSYHKKILELNGVLSKSVDINLHDLSIDFDQIKNAITPRTRGIVICTPNNPSGKVFSKEELLAIAKLAMQHDLYIITDEIYEYVTYEGYEHISMASLGDVAKRTITISGFSKTYSVTGWRLGYACGPKEIIEKMSLVHDLLYICPVTPLQYAILPGLQLDESYYRNMRETYTKKRDAIIKAFQEKGFKVFMPQGTYYMMVDFSSLGFADDEKAVDMILAKAKIATVAGRAFYTQPEKGKHLLRVCYALTEDKIEQAVKLLRDSVF